MLSIDKFTAWLRRSSERNGHRNTGTDHVAGSVVPAPFALTLAGLVAVLIALGVLGIGFDGDAGQQRMLPLLQLGLAAFGLALLLLLMVRIYRQFLQPMSHLRDWAWRMRGGNLSSRVPVPPRGEFSELAQDINALGEWLQNLTEDIDRQVRLQTKKLEQKTYSLEVLYDVAASINRSRDLDELLGSFLSTLMEIVDARAAAVRLLHGEDRMRLVASIGLDEKAIESEQFTPIDSCLCGSAAVDGKMVCQEDVRLCQAQLGRSMLPHDRMQMIAVPLQYGGKTLGVCNLFVDRDSKIQQRMEQRNLLNTIGQHLGMAIEKSRLDHQTQRLSIMQEREMIAHELHDSLAQTLASLRMQIRMHKETVDSSGNILARAEVVQIMEGLEQAYRELRELLDHFRVRMDERGLVPAIEEYLRQFRADTGISVFFQCPCHAPELPPSYEVQVLRIVQEAFANIRKHSQAHTARLLFSCDGEGNYRVLVEDDGIGHMARYEDGGPGRPGEHIGISVMRERTRQISGELTIESESSEGTRVELTFHYPTIRTTM